MSNPSSAPRIVRVWDIWVRLFHWSLAIAISVLVFTGRTGEWFVEWHRLAGELVLTLLVFRLLWGLVGSCNARLLPLFVSPRRAIVHFQQLLARRVPRETRHNDAGGWAVLILLLLLAVQALTGMLIADEDEIVEGALYGMLSVDISDWLWQVHHTNAQLLQIAIVVHVVMILVYLLYARLNLVAPMISGRVRAEADHASPLHSPTWGSAWLGLGCAVLAFAGVGWLSGWF